MRKKGILFLFLVGVLPFCANTQQNLLPLSSYYKDKLFSPFDSTSFSEGSFLPASESQLDLHKKIADSSKQYYVFTSLLFKKHLFEVKGDDYYITISPTIDVAIGEDKADSVVPRKFNNTRGFIIEGDLFKNFSFSTSFYENQTRFTNYERSYYLSVGEMYPNGVNYTTQNAVIPGGARTKPFKVDGFDYAYAIGNFVYAPSKRVQISTGNNAHFVGAGYRSLLLSDNSIYAPYVQANIKLSDKWSFVYMRAKLMNLMRRPIYTTDEAYYEPKALSVNYITYKASKKLNISLFEGIVWSKGDSITSVKTNPMFYNPIPGLAQIAVSDENTMSHLVGLNTEYMLSHKHRVYSQVAMSNFDTKNIGFQIGYRGYNFDRVKDLMLQVEYNYVPKSLYTSSNRRLNYSHYNLPLAHTKGNGFQEFVIRSNYEYQRVYIDVKIVVYQLTQFQSGSLLAVDKQAIKQFGNIQHEQIEVGYRMNRKLNLTLFGTYMYRTDNSLPTTSFTQYLMVGLRTGLINHYNDF